MKIIFGLLIYIAAFSPIHCYADQHSSFEDNNWKTECVGRYQISLPGEVEIALDKLTHTGTSKNANYADGLIAPFSQLSYSGYLSIISPATPKEFKTYKKIILNNQERIKQEYLKSGSDKFKKWTKNMKPMSYDSQTMFGWDIKDANPRITYFLENKLYSYSINNNVDDSNSLNNIHFNDFLNGFRARALYSLPNQPGVCIPYGFIADDGTAPRDIGVTMRLIDHPDVEIYFRDTSSYLTGGTLHSPKDEIKYFWTIMYQKFTKLTEADFGGYRSIKMGGQAGKGMFVTIHRYDDSIDYGYIAIVDDIPNTPSQMLYVIRTAARAKGEPVSKDELKDMAEKIMASVKPHPVQ